MPTFYSYNSYCKTWQNVLYNILSIMATDELIVTV